MPHRVRKVVVLPAPFGPSNPRIWPGSTEKLRFFTAVKPLYCLLKFVTVIICFLLNTIRFSGGLTGWNASRGRSICRCFAPDHVKSKFKTDAPGDYCDRIRANQGKFLVGESAASVDQHLAQIPRRSKRPNSTELDLTQSSHLHRMAGRRSGSQRRRMPPSVSYGPDLPAEFNGPTGSIVRTPVTRPEPIAAAPPQVGFEPKPTKCYVIANDGFHSWRHIYTSIFISAIGCIPNPLKARTQPNSTWACNVIRPPTGRDLMK